MADHVTIDWQNKSHQELDCSCRLPHQVITRREYYKSNGPYYYSSISEEANGNAETSLFSECLIGDLHNGNG
jgi:hypothetical protein